MSNLLALPFKKTYPADIKTAARQYISDYGGMHPDEFREDIKQWQDLRKEGVGGVVHENQINSILLYHAQLISILTKLPANIDLSISYSPAFHSSSIPVTLNNVVFERASVLFNLAALYSQLATAEDRSSTEGIKRAAQYYQNAVGTLSYLATSILPKFVLSPDDEDVPLDLSPDFIKALEQMFLAQAQECSWQLAKLSQYRNSLIAKIAIRVSTLYESAASLIRGSPSAIQRSFPADWLPHIEAKQHHFAAVAEYRESVVEYEASRYGVELARLGRAQNEATQAYDIARKGKVGPSVMHDVQSLLETVKNSRNRSQRDNDLIYHQDVPASSALKTIQETNLVSPNVPKSLVNPSNVLGDRPLLFKDLIGWGAREAINIYDNRKQCLIQEKILDTSQELQDQADERLRKLNLPASLEALERPIGLPPSLLRKAEEVRLEDGSAKIEASIEDVERLAHLDSAILDEALDILDSEASEDEAARKEIPLNRLKSHEANIELIEKSKRYRSILSQANASDESVRQKWYEWEDSIRELMLDEAILEASVPSTTGSSNTQTSPQGQQTRQHARALRVKLEGLDTLRKDSEQLVYRARTVAASDNIQDRIATVSNGFERLVEVHPEMFEDVLDEELAKYDKFLSEMTELERRQKELLDDIQDQNRLFIESRKEDPVIKEREQALQALDSAYFKYREITRNLDEGFKFYNDLAGILSQFKEICRAWSLQRNQEMHTLSRSMKSMSLTDRNEEDKLKRLSKTSQQPGQVGTPSRKVPAPAPTPHKVQQSKLSNLPALNSDEWDFQEVALPPGPKDK